MSLKINGLKIAVFDWDNTLAQSRTSLVYAVNQVLESYRMPNWDIVQKKRDNNLSFRDNFPRIFGSKADEAYKKYQKIYKANVHRFIKPFPKAFEVLEFLKQHQVLLMIMTNKDRTLFEHELPLLFDPDLFDNTVCGHEADQDKPFAPHLIYTVKDILPASEITPKRVWVIGDSPQDSACAQAAGAKAIRIGAPIWKEDFENDNAGILFFDSLINFHKQLIKDNI